MHPRCRGNQCIARLRRMRSLLCFRNQSPTQFSDCLRHSAVSVRQTRRVDEAPATLPVCPVFYPPEASRSRIAVPGTQSRSTSAKAGAVAPTTALPQRPAAALWSETQCSYRADISKLNLARLPLQSREVHINAIFRQTPQRIPQSLSRRLSLNRRTHLCDNLRPPCQFLLRHSIQTVAFAAPPVAVPHFQLYPKQR